MDYDTTCLDHKTCFHSWYTYSSLNEWLKNWFGQKTEAVGRWQGYIYISISLTWNHGHGQDAGWSIKHIQTLLELSKSCYFYSGQLTCYFLILQITLDNYKEFKEKIITVAAFIFKTWGFCFNHVQTSKRITLETKRIWSLKLARSKYSPEQSTWLQNPFITFIEEISPITTINIRQGK